MFTHGGYTPQPAECQAGRGGRMENQVGIPGPHTGAIPNFVFE